MVVKSAKQELGLLIKSIRNHHGIDRVEFAKKCQIGEHVISRVERGHGDCCKEVLEIIIKNLNVVEDAIKNIITKNLLIIYPPSRRKGPVFRKTLT